MKTAVKKDRLYPDILFPIVQFSGQKPFPKFKINWVKQGNSKSNEFVLFGGYGYYPGE